MAEQRQQTSPSIRYFVFMCVEQLSHWIAAPGWQITQLTTQCHTTGPSIIQEAVENATLNAVLYLCLPLCSCFAHLLRVISFLQPFLPFPLVLN